MEEKQNDMYEFEQPLGDERFKRVGGLDTQQARTLDKKHRFLVAYQKTGGNIKRACEHAGIKSTKTFYNWCRSDPEFKRTLRLSLEMQQSFVMDLMMMRILKGDGAAIRWWLTKNHPDYKHARYNRPKPKGWT